MYWMPTLVRLRKGKIVPSMYTALTTKISGKCCLTLRLLASIVTPEIIPKFPKNTKQSNSRWVTMLRVSI